MIDSGNPDNASHTRAEAPGVASMSVSELTALAIAAAKSDRWAEGIRLNKAIVKLAARDWRAWARLGHCQAQAGDQAAAIASYREALAIERHAAVHNDLGVLLIDAGDGAGAAAEFQNAISMKPSDPVALSNLGSALRLMNKKHEARQAFERSIALDPTNATAHGNLGNLLRDLGETDAALRSLQECIRLQPGNASAFAFLAGALLEAGRANDALSAIEHALRLDPVNRTAFAYKSAALQEVGDLKAARFLLDLDNLIDVKTSAQVAGYASLKDFNKKLAAHVLQHPTLSFERTGNATRFGSHTANLLLGEEGVSADLESLVNERVREYFASREIQPDHPFMAHRMKAWSSVAWGVVMRSGGHQIPHIHPSAWLSGVYYVKVPASVRADSSTREGWIEFGSPPESLGCKRQEIKKFLFPEEGKLILFPSYFYHRTVPLETDDERISIAFDVSPGSPGGQGQ